MIADYPAMHFLVIEEVLPSFGYILLRHRQSFAWSDLLTKAESLVTAYHRQKPKLFNYSKQQMIT